MSESAILHIDRTSLLHELKSWFKIARPKKTEQVLLSFDGELLHMDMSRARVKVPAHGSWAGQVRVAVLFLVSIVKFPPSGDPIILRVEDGRLLVGTTSYPCEWQATAKSLIQLPIDVNTPLLLALKLRYTADQIRTSGLKAVVDEAEEKCNRNVNTAMKALAKYGIKPADLRALIDKALRESGLTGKI